MMDEFGAPTDTQFLDWAEHNDHAEGNDDHDQAPDTIDVLDRLRRMLESSLATTLSAVEMYEFVNYRRRNEQIITALNYATALGYRCGIACDVERQPDFPILVYIELPGAGQVSWHLPAYETEWDGHDQAEKYSRVRQYIRVTSMKV